MPCFVLWNYEPCNSLNGGSPKWHVLYTDPENVTLLGGRVFAGAITLRIWKGNHPRSPKWALNPMISILKRYRKREGKWSREGLVKTKSEIGMRQPRAKESLELTESRRGKESFSPGAFWGKMAWQTPWVWTPSLENYGKYISHCQPPSLWQLVTAALGNLCNILRLLLPKLFASWPLVVFGQWKTLIGDGMVGEEKSWNVLFYYPPCPTPSSTLSEYIFGNSYDPSSKDSASSQLWVHDFLSFSLYSQG